MGAVLTAQAADDRLSNRNFEALARYIYDYSGIKMPASKLTMLEGRLRRRLRATGIETFNDYCDFLFRHGGIETESIYLIDAVTTNKTDFFREPKHFEHLQQIGLPELYAAGHKRMRFWSSACSTGAEPYTMAMVLAEFAVENRDFEYKILATDLSTDVLQVARRGIYPQEMMGPVPAPLKKKYVMMARDAERRDARVVPKLRATVGFARMNLMDDAYKVGDPMHVIFCRNVLIYFDKPTQAAVLSRLCDCLLPGGYLLIGHSETVTGIDLPIRQVANTVFKKV
ncbi:CheR family methyltransferase [Pararhizobium antarcticum]|uniref:Chemotaxis protein methyltransferase n=1 Tax=Pararhizobium antarcticum TaxID=1798805 RepID=A0A657LQT8_9HYPH|nr:CheR family methyltransferase [Pararhizobium antarcticum]OJF95310.1 chemotaxis protein CheR [Pararhizobium antarcticum]OJF96326.1 chemotaxis protein CheR [Rhizobium sp. 58]